MGLQRSRYIGLSPTQVQNATTAAIVKVARIVDWLSVEETDETRDRPGLANRFYNICKCN